MIRDQSSFVRGEHSVRFWSFFCLLVLLYGCVDSLFVERHADVQRARPIGKPERYLLSLRMPTGHWGCSAHGGGLYREVGYRHLRLPYLPSYQTEYAAHELVIEREEYWEEAGYSGVPTAGTVRINVPEEQVIVSLETPDGPFRGNGTYPLHISTALPGEYGAKTCYGSKLKTPYGLKESSECARPMSPPSRRTPAQE